MNDNDLTPAAVLGPAVPATPSGPQAELTE